MSIKRVIVTGAGFSAPADLPVQNKILDLMKQKPSPDFMSSSRPNSFKFMNAYITVGLYLLDKYAKTDYSEYKNNLFEVQKRANDNAAIESILTALSSNKIETGKDAIEYVKSCRFNSNQKYKELNKLVDMVRNALVSEKIDVNLEDVFTSFDKSMMDKQYMDNYSYAQIDAIRLSITRLFVYYFDQAVHDHKYDKTDYINFVKYIKARRSSVPLTIITTNWDTLIEEYLAKNKIDYNLCLNEKYYYIDDEEVGSQTGCNLLKLIKIHGSINWFRCLNCGTLSIYKKHTISDLLFDDDNSEKCIKCNSMGDEETEILQPDIITPTMIKSIDSQLYKNLWSTASAELRDADEIIFIGYSMPLADYEFRYMLQKSIKKDSKIDIILHSSDDPKKSCSDINLLPEKRYKDLFPKNDLNFHYDGFKNYFSL